MNKREALRAAGWTVGERGRFSGGMIAYLNDNPDKWTEPVKPEKTAKTPKADAIEVPKGSAKAIRGWAIKNGHTVGARGRINPVVVKAYAEAHGGIAEPVSNKTTLVLNTDEEGNLSTTSEPAEYESFKANVIGPQTKQRNIEKMFVTTPEGTIIGFDTCKACKQHINYCECDEITPPFEGVLASGDSTVEIDDNGKFVLR